jgi:TonB family protein
MTTHSDEKPELGKGARALWHPSTTFMLGLVGGLGVGVLCFHPGARNEAGLVPPNPPEEGRTLRIEGFDDTALPKGEASPAPKATPVRVRLEGKTDYPPLAMRERVQGPVDVIVTVDRRGLPAVCSAPEGNAILRQAALDSAATWRFRPATRLGQPVPSTFRIHFDFKLHPDSAV